MDYESMLMTMVNNHLTSRVTKAQQVQQHEDRSMPNSTRRAFESRMQTDAAVYRVAAQNMEDGRDMVEVAQTGVSGIKSQLQCVEKILTDVATQDSMTLDEYKEANKGLAKRFEEIQKLVKNTSFNGMNLLDGSLGNSSNNLNLYSVVELQSGYSQREQKFMNLLDSSITTPYDNGDQSMNLSFNRLFVGDPSNNISPVFAIDTSSVTTAKSTAQTALTNVKKYIEGIAGLEAQYSYDIKSLDNLSMLFEEQADIFAEAGKRSSAFDKPSMSQNDILSQLLASNSSILSGTT